MKKKLLLIIFIGTILIPIIPVKAVVWGVNAGEIYTYEFCYVDDGMGNPTSREYFYSQDGSTHNGSAGQYWEWELVTVTATEITGIFRCSCGFEDDFVTYDHVDNINPSNLPVTPFFFIQDWVAEGNVDFGMMHGVSPFNPDWYSYGSIHWYYELHMTGGYLVWAGYDDVMFGGDTRMAIDLIDITPASENPNYPPTTTTGVPYTGTTTTPIDDSGDGFGGVLDDFGEALAGVLGILGIEATPEASIFLFLLLFILLLLGYLIYQSRKKPRKITAQKHPVIRRSKKKYKDITKRLGLK